MAVGVEDDALYDFVFLREAQRPPERAHVQNVSATDFGFDDHAGLVKPGAGESSHRESGRNDTGRKAVRPVQRSVNTSIRIQWNTIDLALHKRHVAAEHIIGFERHAAKDR